MKTSDYSLLVVCVWLLAAVPRAMAVPSFARQTGLSCEACHTVFPELTHFGRLFKANGYTLTSLPQVKGAVSERDENLSLNWIPPLSIMAQVSDTHLSKAVPDGTGAAGKAQNDTVAFPQQISLFYAGRIAPNLGVFGQITYSNQAGKVQVDNTDFRFANLTVLPGEQSLIYGLSLNNNPTVQDLWNSTPAFGFPYASSNSAVTPLARTQIDQNLAQTVAGLSGYLYWNQWVYAELGAYRSAKQGFTNNLTGAAGPLDGTATNVIDGLSPYWRLAGEYEWGRHSLELGVYAATFKFFPGGGSATNPASLTGPTNRFADVAEDFQYQFLGDSLIFTLAGTRIHEDQTFGATFPLGGTANPKDSLTTDRLAATLYYRRRYGGTLSYFSTTGNGDSSLYPLGNAPGVVTSASGRPDTSGWIAELDYLPWLNVKLQAQYTAYTKFNGGGANYDGYGRNASANNTLYLLMWLAY